MIAELRVMADEQPPGAVLVLTGRERIATWMARSAWPDPDAETRSGTGVVGHPGGDALVRPSA